MSPPPGDIDASCTAADATDASLLAALIASGRTGQLDGDIINDANMDGAVDSEDVYFITAAASGELCVHHLP